MTDTPSGEVGPPLSIDHEGLTMSDAPATTTYLSERVSDEEEGRKESGVGTSGGDVVRESGWH